MNPPPHERIEADLRQAGPARLVGGSRATFAPESDGTNGALAYLGGR
jgi:hypothetical protein